MPTAGSRPLSLLVSFALLVLGLSVAVWLPALLLLLVLLVPPALVRMTTVVVHVKSSQMLMVQPVPSMPLVQLSSVKVGLWWRARRWPRTSTGRACRQCSGPGPKCPSARRGVGALPVDAHGAPCDLSETGSLVLSLTSPLVPPMLLGPLVSLVLLLLLSPVRMTTLVVPSPSSRWWVASPSVSPLSYRFAH